MTVALEIDATEADGLTIGVDRLDLSCHDCTLTLVSPRTGDHRTFKIETVRGGDLDGKRIVSLLIGQDNDADYQGFGFVTDTGSVIVWRRFRGDGTRDGRTMHERFAALLSDPAYWSDRGVQFLALLRCRRCHHPLTHPDSIADGLGPICRAKLAG